ncbi:MAG TPA: tetratricopeptide repeat protein [Thermoanaerobaculia bacterium]|nr:tetratricopeptide repeat protein [Thermoanaerobaculia bacterium]
MQTHSAPASTQPVIPHPSLEGLEPPVAAHLRLARRRLEASLEAALPAAELGEVYGEVGQLYHAYELLAAARAAYERALALAPGDPRWPYLLALVLEADGDLAGAEARLRDTLALAPEATPASIRLGAILHQLGRLDEAASVVEATLGAGDPASLAVLGEVELARGNHRRAAELLDTALAIAPGAGRLRYPLAQALRALGEVDRAREELAAAGTAGLRPIDPQYERLQALRVGETAHILRGRRALAAGRAADALAEFRLAVDAAPASAGARVNLAAVLAELGRNEEAADQLRIALELDPGQQTARFNLGALLAASGRTEEARLHLEEAVRLDPADSGSRIALAGVLRAQGNLAAALDQLATVRRVQPTREDAWLAAAQYLVDAGSTAQALELLELAHERLPGSARVAHGLARLLAAGPSLELRDGARAVELARLAFGARELPVHAETVALALAEAGRCGEAADWLREALARTSEQDGELRRRLEERLAATAGAIAADRPCRP